MKRNYFAAAVLAAALAGLAHGADLRAELAEARTAAKLAAENTKRYQDTYSDIYFDLGSLTVAEFERRVAAGETVYAYIGTARAAATAMLSSRCSNAISPNTRWTAKSGLSMSTACTRMRKNGRRSSSVTAFPARPCWRNTRAGGSGTSSISRPTAASAGRIWNAGCG
ncbi:hypothetical protein LVJ84_05700 [Kingella potus]|nr:hypothetical protein [Kingella potus]UOP01643.1 hypothetical protein LVJ84_05700 [Kingella potus]